MSSNIFVHPSSSRNREHVQDQRSTLWGKPVEWFGSISMVAIQSLSYLIRAAYGALALQKAARFQATAQHPALAGG